MKKIYFIMLALTLAACSAAGFMSTGDVSIYLNIPSLFMVCLPALFMSLSSFSLKEIGSAFKAGFITTTAGKDSPEYLELKKGLVFFEGLQKYFAVSAVFGLLVGVTAVLANLNNPDYLGSGIALSLITILYALVLELVLVAPFKTGLKKKLAEAEYQEPEASK